MRAELLFASFCIVVCAQAAAVTFYLDSTSDLPDANPGNGQALTATGQTTLRAAIEEANALPGEDAIIFTYGSSSKSADDKRAFRAGLAFVESPLVVEDDLVVRNGDFLWSSFNPSGMEQFRVLEILPDVNLEMIEIHINESAPLIQNMLADRGAAIYIHAGAHVVLRSCSVSSGIATVAGGGVYVDHSILEVHGGSVNGYSQGDGGGIYNDGGSVYAIDDAGLHGYADSRGGGVFNDDGLVYFQAATHSSNLRGRDSLKGGGLYSQGGSIVMESAGIQISTAQDGAGIYLRGGATLDLFGCVFEGNAAEVDGGAIYVEDGTVRAAMTTFGQGTAGRSGAGVYVVKGDAAFINCTFAGNMAATSEAGLGGGIALDPAGDATCLIGNGIIATNTAGTGEPGADVSGAFTSLGHNLIGVGDGATGFVASDLAGTVAEPLAPLLTYTSNHAGTPESPRGIYTTNAGSPARDAGDDTLLFHTDFFGSPCFDARLTCCPRVRGAAVDIGAIEAQTGEIVDICAGEGEGEGENSEGENSEGGSEGEGENSEGGNSEGGSEGEGEGENSEGENSEGGNEGEGDVCLPGAVHTADWDGDYQISLSEALRVVQLFNAGGFGCELGTDDGYTPGGTDRTCCPYAGDCQGAPDWRIDLNELLRLIQFFNIGGYHACPNTGTEDGYCPGL